MKHYEWLCFFWRGLRGSAWQAGLLLGSLATSVAACGPHLGGSKSHSAVSFGSGLAKVEPAPGMAQREREMHQLVNRDRKSRGLPALAWDAALADVARHHSADMRDHGFFEHESPNSGLLEERLDAAGYLFLTARENLSEAKDVATSQAGLLASPPHFANLTASDISHVGIGIVPGGVVDPQNLCVTQVFATPGKLESPARAEAALWKRLAQERKRKSLPRLSQHQQLSNLARDNIGSLVPDAGAEGADVLSERLAPAARDAKLSALLISVQIVPDSAHWVLPDLLLRERRVALGLAVRRVTVERGRPALQVLAIAGPETVR